MPRREVLSPGLWSDRCGWLDLADRITSLGEERHGLRQGEDWSRQWTATWCRSGGEVTSPVRDLAAMPLAGCEPVRRFSWRRGQRHRPGLQYLVSTGRLHGFESLAEARLLLMLDFAGDLIDVLSQPVRLRYQVGDQWRAHTPDFLADTRSGRWLIDVRPAARVQAQDRVAFAAAAEAALVAGWGYVVVTGWHRHAAMSVDTLSSQRRPLADPLNLVPELLAAAAAEPVPLADLVQATPMPAVARAFALHLLWRRRLGIDLAVPLGDTTPVWTAGQGAR